MKIRLFLAMVVLTVAMETVRRNSMWKRNHSVELSRAEMAWKLN